MDFGILALSKIENTSNILNKPSKFCSIWQKNTLVGGLPVTPEVFQFQKNSLRRGIVDVPFLLAESFI